MPGILKRLLSFSEYKTGDRASSKNTRQSRQRFRISADYKGNAEYQKKPYPYQRVEPAEE